MHAHPHAKSTHKDIQVVLSPYYTHDDVVGHFHRIIYTRKDQFKPFYIGATTRPPLDRFNLPCRPAHSEVYNGMIVGWVGNAANAKRIERLVIEMAHRCFPHHVVNIRGTGGEGINAGGEHASVYMCYGGRHQMLLGRYR